MTTTAFATIGRALGRRRPPGPPPAAARPPSPGGGRSEHSPPPRPQSAIRNPQSAIRAIRNPQFLLILAATVGRLILAAALGPGNDEAYYALYAEHPAWSYYDQPPMVGWIAIAGRSAGGWFGLGGSSALALRLGFVAIGAGSIGAMARLGARLYGPRAAFPSALAIVAAGYLGTAAGTFALPDGPLLFFGLLAVERLAAAMEDGPGNLGRWAVAGLAWGGALLSKYHAALLPVGVVAYLLFEPTARPWLRRPGPYLAAAVGLAMFAPVIGWNAAHGWASFAFQGSRALGAPAFRPAEIAGATLGPLAYLFPWIGLALIAALARAWRRGLRPADRLLACLATPTIVAFAIVGCSRPVLPHWPLIGWALLLPILGDRWADRRTVAPRAARRRLWIAGLAPAVVGAILVAQVNGGIVPWRATGTGASRRPDPSMEMFGWDQVAAELERRGLLDRPETFLFTGGWHTTGQLAFAIGGRRPVLCYNAGDARGFAGWSDPGEWVGRDGVLVAVDDRTAEPECFAPWFERIEPLGAFAIERGGRPARSVRLFWGVRQLRAFPYQGVGTVGSERRPDGPMGEVLQ